MLTGEAGSGKRPLNGIRILDLTRHLAGAGATRALGLLGAEILRIEWPHLPALDFLRLMRPYVGDEPGLNRGGFFAQINVHKQSVGIDLSLPEGREIVRALVPLCDVVIDSFTPSVMAKWGFDYAALRALRDDIICVAAPGFGHTGPYRNYRSVGPTAQAYSGLTATVGLPEREPAGWGFSYMDHMGAMMNAAAVLMALERRRHTGRGEFIDGGQTQHGVAVLGPMLLDVSMNGSHIWPRGNRDLYRNLCPSNAYRCPGEDSWVAISVTNNGEWIALCREMGADDLAARPELRELAGRLAAEDEIDERVAAWTASQDPYAVMERLQAAGVPAGTVQTVKDKVERDSALCHAGFYQVVADPVLGARRYEAMPMRMEGFETAITRPRPFLGEHTRPVLQRLLGYSDARIDELITSGVLHEAEMVVSAAAS